MLEKLDFVILRMKFLKRTCFIQYLTLKIHVVKV
jgi:hypothetical protein